MPDMDPGLTKRAVDAAKGSWRKWYTAGVHDCQRFAATVYLKYLRMGGRPAEELPRWFEKDIETVQEWEREWQRWEDFKEWFSSPSESPSW